MHGVKHRKKFTPLTKVIDKAHF